ncbi:MAG TPA: hypothetical protein VNJ07_06515 [Chitinophagales bacterium]|nr:hypothetical protein [Chitinophagales bacterium]
MAKKPNHSDVINRFVNSYIEKFKGNVDATRLVMNLIADDLTDLERLRNYLIIEEYYELLRENNGISYLTLIQLSDKFELTERQIQNIVYKWSDKYKKSSNIAPA